MPAKITLKSRRLELSFYQTRYQTLWCLEQIRMRGVEGRARDAELRGGCKARLATAQHSGPGGGAPASH